MFAFYLLIGLNQVQAAADFVHCYDFGCKSTQEISYSPKQWQSIHKIFDQPALSSWLEKQQIRRAIALMEQYSGALVGTDQDKAGNYPGEDIPRQQDCIDESTNTLQYLYALQDRHLLHWHQVEGKQHRIVWFADHWTAVIREKHSDALIAVDSWYRDNGEMPYLQPLPAWQRRANFPVALNPE